MSTAAYARWALTPEHERASAVPMQDLTNTRPSFREFPIILGIREDSHISVANLWPNLALFDQDLDASNWEVMDWHSDYDPRGSHIGSHSDGTKEAAGLWQINQAKTPPDQSVNAYDGINYKHYPMWIDWDRRHVYLGHPGIHHADLVNEFNLGRHSEDRYDYGALVPANYEMTQPYDKLFWYSEYNHPQANNLTTTLQQYLKTPIYPEKDMKYYGSHKREAAFNVVPHEDPQPELSDPLNGVPFLFHSPTRTLHIGWPGGYHDDLRQKLEVGHTSPDWYEGWTGRLDGSSPTSVYYTGPEAHSIAHGQMTNALQDHFGVPMVPDRARWKFAWDAQAEPQNPHDWMAPYMATNIYGRSNIPFLHYPHSDHTYFSPAGLHDAINTRQEDMGMSNLRGRLFVGRDKGVLNWYDRGVFPEHDVLRQRLEQQIGVPITHKGQGYYLREGSEMWKLAWAGGKDLRPLVIERNNKTGEHQVSIGMPGDAHPYTPYHPDWEEAVRTYIPAEGPQGVNPYEEGHYLNQYYPMVQRKWNEMEAFQALPQEEKDAHWNRRMHAMGQHEPDAKYGGPKADCVECQEAGHFAKTAGETYPQTVRRWQTLGPLDHSDLIHTFPDGHTIHRLHSYGDVGKVGLQLVNCWKGRAGFSDPSRPINQPTDFWDTPQPMHYMSLHDPNDVPRVGFYVHDNKVQEGFAARNKRPAPEHLQMLKDYAAMNGHEFEEPDYDHPIYQEYHFGEPAPGIQGTMGEGIPAGRMAGDANPWSPYYHVTLPMHRDSILQRGLEPREPLGGGMGSGVYVYKDRPKTWPMLDMWEIDPQHYKWEPDYNTEGAVYSPQPIDPAHMRLIPDKMAGGFTKQDMFTCGNCGSHAMSEPTKMGNGWSQTCTVCGRSRMVDPTHPFIRALMMMDPQYPAELQELNVGRPMNVFGSEEDDSKVEETPEPEPVVASKAPATRKIIVRRDTDGRIASIDAEDGSRSLLVNRDSDGRILEIEEVS